MSTPVFLWLLFSLLVWHLLLATLNHKDCYYELLFDVMKLCPLWTDRDLILWNVDRLYNCRHLAGKANQLIIFRATTVIINQNLLSNDLKGDLGISPYACFLE